MTSNNLIKARPQWLGCSRPWQGLPHASDAWAHAWKLAQARGRPTPGARLRRSRAQSYKLLSISISNQIWRAPVAASVLGGLLVLLFNLLSCAILIRRVAVRPQHPACSP
jgi:hypothetical protein